MLKLRNKIFGYLELRSLSSLRPHKFGLQNYYRLASLSYANELRFKYFSTSQPQSTTHNDLWLDGLIAMLKTKNINSLNEVVNEINSNITQGKFNKDQFNIFLSAINEILVTIPVNYKLDNEEVLVSLNRLGDLINALLQSNVENLDPVTLARLLVTISKYPIQPFKKVFHFSEFLINRTGFSELLTSHTLTTILGVFYEIRENYEKDKYNYMLEQIDLIICQTKELNFDENDLARFLYIYSINTMGSKMMFVKLFAEYQRLYKTMDIKNLIYCLWAFVNYNLQQKSKTFKIFTPEIEARFSNNAPKLNGYLINMYLWAWKKEKDMFGRH